MEENRNFDRISLIINGIQRDVVCQPDKPKGRSGKIVPTPVKETALEAGVPVPPPQSQTILA